jgi:hypothetical protein
MPHLAIRVTEKCAKSFVVVGRKAGQDYPLMKKLTTITTWSGRYPVAKKLHQHAEGGLVPEWIFDDPMSAAADTVIMITKLRKLLDDGTRPLKAGAIVVWSDGEN